MPATYKQSIEEVYSYLKERKVIATEVQQRIGGWRTDVGAVSGGVGSISKNHPSHYKYKSPKQFL